MNDSAGFLFAAIWCVGFTFGFIVNWCECKKAEKRARK